MKVTIRVRSGANGSMYNRLDLNKQLGIQRTTLKENLAVRTITV